MKKKCDKCNGSGTIYYTYQDGDHTHTMDDTCDICEGTGLVEDKWVAPIAKCRNSVEPSIYQRAIYLWGEQAQIGMAIEELGELIVKLAKWGRNHNGSTIGDVVEEIADVEIMMEQLRLIMGNDLVESEKRKKLARLEELVKYGEGTA
jgi:hypothetical protein